MRGATFEAALASSRPRTPTWERASASLESSPNLSPPRDHRSPRRSTSPYAEMTVLMQLFQLQMQQAADREQRHEEQHRQTNTAKKNGAVKTDGKLRSYDVRPPNARRAWKSVFYRRRLHPPARTGSARRPKTFVHLEGRRMRRLTSLSLLICSARTRSL